MSNNSLAYTPSCRRTPLRMWIPVWGPNHQRILKKLRIKGVQLHVDGVWKQVEIYGPEDFKLWEECHELLITGLIGFEAVSLGTLLDYRKKIRGYLDRYGAPVRESQNLAFIEFCTAAYGRRHHWLKSRMITLYQRV